MVIAAECSLESKFALISSHVLRRAVVHECPLRGINAYYFDCCHTVKQ